MSDNRHPKTKSQKGLLYLLLSLAGIIALFAICTSGTNDAEKPEATTPANYAYISLDEYEQKLKGHAFLHSVTRKPNGAIMVAYYNSYAAFQQLSPKASRFGKDYFNSYWRTGQAADKAFIHAVFTAFARLPDVTGIAVITPEGTRMLSSADFQVAAGASLADLRQPGALDQALDDHLYNDAIRSRFLARFPPQNSKAAL